MPVALGKTALIGQFDQPGDYAMGAKPRLKASHAVMEKVDY